MQTNDGRLIVISGASRSGKTAYVKKATAKDQRVIAWDPEDQWAQLPGWKRITTRAQLTALVKSNGNFKAGFVVGGDLKSAFDFWAMAVMYAGKHVGPLTAIGEELADVSTPGKAPQHWGILIRRGLKRGINIYAISQRWAEADKTAIGNASEFVVFRASGDDVRYIARKSRIPENEIEALKPTYKPDGKPKVLPYIRIDTIGNIQHAALKF